MVASLGTVGRGHKPTDVKALFVLVNNGVMAKTHNPEWWGHLHWLTVLATQGSFTAAARRLGVSKAAVSQRIAELERAAGVPLVRRTTRSVRLTDAGQRLVDEVAGAYAEIEQGWARVRDLAGQPSGLVRMTAPVALARQVLVPLLVTFAQAQPRVRVELDLSDRLVSLAAEGFDLAVRHTHAPPDTHVAWRLCATRSVLVAAPAFVQRQGALQHPAQLSQCPCLHYPRPGARPLWTFEPVHGGERVTVPVQGPLAATNSEALRDAALAGLGVALVPDFSARAALAAGTLHEVLPDWRPVDAFAPSIWAIRPWTPHVPAAVAALVAHLRAALADAPDQA